MENAEQTNRIVVQVSASQKNAIIDAAKREGLTVSEYIRVHTIARPMRWFTVTYRSNIDKSLQVVPFRAVNMKDVENCFDGLGFISAEEIVSDEFIQDSQNAQDDEDDYAATIRDARPY